MKNSELLSTIIISAIMPSFFAYIYSGLEIEPVVFVVVSAVFFSTAMMSDKRLLSMIMSMSTVLSIASIAYVSGGYVSSFGFVLLAFLPIVVRYTKLDKFYLGIAGIIIALISMYLFSGSYAFTLSFIGMGFGVTFGIEEVE